MSGVYCLYVMATTTDEGTEATVHYNVDTHRYHTSKECAGTNDTLIFSGPASVWADGMACTRCGANELRKEREHTH